MAWSGLVIKDLGRVGYWSEQEQPLPPSPQMPTPCPRPPAVPSESLGHMFSDASLLIAQPRELFLLLPNTFRQKNH